MKFKCFCKKDNACGEYKNQVVMESPFVCYNVLGNKKSNRVCIDSCIASIITYLWYNGIETISSCCGHGNDNLAHVIVADSSVEKIKKLGFKKSYIKGARPDNTFILKTK